MSTFVSVGNARQPFQRLLDAVAAVAARLPQPVVVQHGVGDFGAPGCYRRRLIPMAEFERLVAEAELLILHAGAGSVMHALQAGKVPIVMPRRVAFKECVDDHQVEFAEALSQAGRVVVVHDTEQMCAAIDRALALQGRLGNAGTRVPALVRLLEERLNHYSEVLRR